MTSEPRTADWAWADAVILVKRAAEQWGAEAKASHLPIVWDVLDYWRQPHGNSFSREQLIAEVFRVRDTLKPAAMIGATQQMAADIGGVYIPHHCRIGLTAKPVRPDVRMVTYDGSERYLGQWSLRIEQECHRRGWWFAVNPTSIAEADILVSFRDGQWDGWGCRHWKSGVKLVNAIACGRPMLSQRCAAWDEVNAQGAEIEDPAHLSARLDALAAIETRQAIYDRCLARAHEFTVESVAKQYRDLLASVGVRCAA